MSKPVAVERELSSDEAFTRLGEMFHDMTAKLAASVRDVSIRKLGRFVIWRVVFRRPLVIEGKPVEEVTFRMPRARAQSIRLQLNKVLD